MQYTFTGTVKIIFDEKTFDSGFNKRAFVVSEETDKYPQDIKFECIKDKVAMLDKLQVNERVTVSFNLKGSEWQTKFFVNLEAWRIESLGMAAPKIDPEDEVLDEEPPF